MIRFLFKQPKYLWRSQSWPNRLEIIILAGMIFVFLVGRIAGGFEQLLAKFHITTWTLAAHIVHFLVLSIWLSAPFVLSYTLPRLKFISLFYGQPLSDKQLVEMLAYFYHKYLIVFFLLSVLLFASLGLLAPFTALTAFVVLLIYDLILFYLMVNLIGIFGRNRRFLTVTIALAIGYGLISAAFIIFNASIWRWDASFCLLLGLWFYWHRSDALKFDLETLYPLKEVRFRKKAPKIWNLQNFFTVLPQKMRALFFKEMAASWRNPRYRKLKIYTFVFYFIIQAGFYFGEVARADMWMIVSGLLLIYLHYAQYFNTKYAGTDPRWFMLTMPIRFAQLWFARFWAEFLFVLLLVFGQGIFLLSIGSDFAVLLNWLGVLLLFAVIVLSVVINFQIYFYEDLRLAGYLYHFTVLFILVLSVNYRLVGPLVSVVFLMIHSYKSYRFFNS